MIIWGVCCGSECLWFREYIDREFLFPVDAVPGSTRCKTRRWLSASAIESDGESVQRKARLTMQVKSHVVHRTGVVFDRVPAWYIWGKCETQPTERLASDAIPSFLTPMPTFCHTVARIAVQIYLAACSGYVCLRGWFVHMFSSLSCAAVIRHTQKVRVPCAESSAEKEVDYSYRLLWAAPYMPGKPRC